MSDSEALASDIERSAFEVAQRQPEGQRAGTYAKVASRLLINAVLKQVGRPLETLLLHTLPGRG